MKKKFFLPLIIFAVSCNSEISNPNKKINMNNDSLWNVASKDVECEKGLSFVCDFEAFDIEIKDVKEMEDKETMVKVYNWMVNSVFHGSEIYALNKIVFDGSPENQNVLGSYDPRTKIISVFPRNPYAKVEAKVLKWVAKKFGKEEITTFDWEYWQYTLSHEYGHHQTSIYGSKNQLPKIGKDGGNPDFEANNVGEKFLDNFIEIPLSKRAEFSKKANKGETTPIIGIDLSGEDVISPYSSGRNKCTPEDEEQNRKNVWPNSFITDEKNGYYWTNAERMTRAFQMLTFQVPSEFHNEKSISAFGTITDDYWWFNYYEANPYENFIDKKCKPLQSKLNAKLAKFKTFIKDEWFNEDDKQISASSFSSDKFYLFSPFGNKEIKLVSVNNKQEFLLKEKTSFVNTYYNWRPFDSRKEVSFDVNSHPYVSDGQIPPGKYKVLMNNSSIKKAFDLKEDETKLIGSSKKYFDKFSMEKEGLFLEVNS